MAGGKQKAWNYNHSIIAACDRVESLGKRRFGEFDICMPDVELWPTCPKLREQLLEFQIRGLFATPVADN
jgi:hypothetical protein